MLITHRVLSFLLPLFVSAPSTHMASCDRALRRMEGWTIVRVTQIQSTFNGCDFNRLIEFVDGTKIRCSSYGYQYAFMPDAIVFAKSISVGDRSVAMVKMMVEGEMYDMASAPLDAK